jgi:hypothetical protein
VTLAIVMACDFHILVLGNFLLKLQVNLDPQDMNIYLSSVDEVKLLPIFPLSYDDIFRQKQEHFEVVHYKPLLASGAFVENLGLFYDLLVDVEQNLVFQSWTQ